MGPCHFNSLPLLGAIRCAADWPDDVSWTSFLAEKGKALDFMTVAFRFTDFLDLPLQRATAGNSFERIGKTVGMAFGKKFALSVPIVEWKPVASRWLNKTFLYTHPGTNLKNGLENIKNLSQNLRN